MFTHLDWSDNKMKGKKTNTVGTIPKSNIKIVQKGKIDSLNTKIHGFHFPGLAQALQYKVAGLN